MFPTTRVVSRLIALVLAVALSGCVGSRAPSAHQMPARSTIVAPRTGGTPALVRAPPAGTSFSYQLGGAYPAAPTVGVVARDRHERPAPGIYSICYVNAFQAQPDDIAWWRTRHPGLLLRDASGREIVDTDWGEPLLAIDTQGRRSDLAQIVGEWIDGCAADGYQGVELDNLDSFTRSHGLVTADHALDFAGALIDRAHAAGLAVAQKNVAELSTRARATGFDFAIAEECQVFDECGAYTSAYGEALLLEVEYTDQPRAAFEAACRARGRVSSVTLRDRGLAAAGTPGHVEQWCP